MDFKLISLNVWLGGKLFDSLVKFIDKENPDILAIQEAYNGKGNLPKNLKTVEEFKKKFNFKYFSFAPAYLHVAQGKEVPTGNAIFSKFPITAANVTFIYGYFREESLNMRKNWDAIPRNLQHAEIKIGGKILNVFNTQGIWGENDKDNQKRFKMVRIILDNIKNKENVVLCGDFNVDANTKSIRNIEKYLLNIFKERTSSFNLKRKKEGGFNKSVVDFIFLSKDIKAVKSFVPMVDVSDHMPLVAVLRV